MVGWGVLPPRQRLLTDDPLPLQAGQAAFNGWVKIGRDGAVTVAMAKSEMGQGVVTSLCMLLAEELDADWSRVRWEPSPIDRIYNNIIGWRKFSRFRSGSRRRRLYRFTECGSSSCCWRWRIHRFAERRPNQSDSQWRNRCRRHCSHNRERPQ